MEYKAAVETWDGSSAHHYHTPAPPPMVVMDQAMERVVRMASESAVVIFSLSNCCMCHAVKSLFCSMGVRARVHDLDLDPRGSDIEKALLRLLWEKYSSKTTTSTSGFGRVGVGVPVVFIGGKLIGAMDSVMAFHINGTLVPLLKEAGALWL